MAYGCATTAGSATDDIRPWLDRLFGVFGTPNFIGPGHVCTWSRLFGSKHTYGVSTPRPDTENANCILLWGINPRRRTRSAPDGSPARQRGAKLIVIDPREHTGQKGGLLAARAPRRDGAPALAMLHVLFDEDPIDTDFARNWTNAPFGPHRHRRSAVGTDMSVDAGKIPGCPRLKNEPRGNMIPKQIRGERDRPIAVRPFDCSLPDGSTVRCETVLDLLRRAPPNIPRKINRYTCSLEDVRRAAQMFTGVRPDTSLTGRNIPVRCR